jgi:hypothetical protein
MDVPLVATVEERTGRPGCRSAALQETPQGEAQDADRDVAADGQSRVDGRGRRPRRGIGLLAAALSQPSDTAAASEAMRFLASRVTTLAPGPRAEEAMALDKHSSSLREHGVGLLVTGPIPAQASAGRTAQGSRRGDSLAQRYRGPACRPYWIQPCSRTIRHQRTGSPLGRRRRSAAARGPRDRSQRRDVLAARRRARGGRSCASGAVRRCGACVECSCLTSRVFGHWRDSPGRTTLESEASAHAEVGGSSCD